MTLFLVLNTAAAGVIAFACISATISDGEEVLVESTFDEYPSDPYSVPLSLEFLNIGTGIWNASYALFLIVIGMIWGTVTKHDPTFVAGMPNSLAAAGIIISQIAYGIFRIVVLSFHNYRDSPLYKAQPIIFHYTMLMVAFFVHNLIVSIYPKRRTRDHEDDYKYDDEESSYNVDGGDLTGDDDSNDIESQRNSDNEAQQVEESGDNDEENPTAANYENENQITSLIRASSSFLSRVSTGLKEALLIEDKNFDFLGNNSAEPTATQQVEKPATVMKTDQPSTVRESATSNFLGSAKTSKTGQTSMKQKIDSNNTQEFFEDAEEGLSVFGHEIEWDASAHRSRKRGWPKGVIGSLFSRFHQGKQNIPCSKDSSSICENSKAASVASGLHEDNMDGSSQAKMYTIDHESEAEDPKVDGPSPTGPCQLVPCQGLDPADLLCGNIDKDDDSTISEGAEGTTDHESKPGSEVASTSSKKDKEEPKCDESKADKYGNEDESYATESLTSFESKAKNRVIVNVERSFSNSSRSSWSSWSSWSSSFQNDQFPAEYESQSVNNHVSVESNFQSINDKPIKTSSEDKLESTIGQEVDCNGSFNGNGSSRAGKVEDGKASSVASSTNGSTDDMQSTIGHEVEWNGSLKSSGITGTVEDSRANNVASSSNRSTDDIQSTIGHEVEWNGSLKSRKKEDMADDGKASSVAPSTNRSTNDMQSTIGHEVEWDGSIKSSRKGDMAEDGKASSVAITTSSVASSTNRSNDDMQSTIGHEVEWDGSIKSSSKAGIVVSSTIRSSLECHVEENSAKNFSVHLVKTSQRESESVSRESELDSRSSLETGTVETLEPPAIQTSRTSSIKRMWSKGPGRVGSFLSGFRTTQQQEDQSAGSDESLEGSIAYFVDDNSDSDFDKNSIHLRKPTNAGEVVTTTTNGPKIDEEPLHPSSVEAVDTTQLNMEKVYNWMALSEDSTPCRPKQSMDSSQVNLNFVCDRLGYVMCSKTYDKPSSRGKPWTVGDMKKELETTYQSMEQTHFVDFDEEISASSSERENGDSTDADSFLSEEIEIIMPKELASPKQSETTIQDEPASSEVEEPSSDDQKLVTTTTHRRRRVVSMLSSGGSRLRPQRKKRPKSWRKKSQQPQKVLDIPTPIKEEEEKWSTTDGSAQYSNAVVARNANNESELQSEDTSLSPRSLKEPSASPEDKHEEKEEDNNNKLRVKSSVARKRSIGTLKNDLRQIESAFVGKIPGTSQNEDTTEEDGEESRDDDFTDSVIVNEQIAHDDPDIKQAMSIGGTSTYSTPSLNTISPTQMAIIEAKQQEQTIQQQQTSRNRPHRERQPSDLTGLRRAVTYDATTIKSITTSFSSTAE
jgi:hypothetical protein